MDGAKVVGALLGPLEGASLGLSDGSFEGSELGVTDGKSLGWLDDTLEGWELGTSVGNADTGNNVGVAELGGDGQVVSVPHISSTYA